MDHFRTWRAVLTTGEFLNLPIKTLGGGLWGSAYGGPWFLTERRAAFSAIPENRLEQLVELRGDGEKTAAEQTDALRAQLATLTAAVRRERNARAAWLASLPDGACGNPPPQALIDAEAATGEVLAAMAGTTP